MADSPYIYTFDPEGDSTAAYVVRGVGRDKYVLELGCAYGVMTKAFVELGHNRVFGIEYDAASAEFAKPYCEELAVIDLEKVDLASVLGDRRFDVIVAADVLEHLREPATHLAALKKFLKPDGYIVLSIPNVAHNGVIAELLNEDFQYRETGLLDSTHLRFWGPQGMKRLIKEAGFTVTDVKASRLPAGKSEFSKSWNQLPDVLQTVLSDRQNGDTYQYVVTAARSENIPAGAPDAWPIEVKLTSLAKYASRVEQAERRAFESEMKQAQLEKETASAVAIMNEMRETLTWRMTRPFRLMARILKRGISPGDRTIVRNAYHRLPIPPVFKKTLSFFVHRVVLRTFKKVTRTLRSMVQFKAPAELTTLQAEDTPDYFFFGVIDWHFRHQRPQQLAKALAASGRRVFYINSHLQLDNRAGFKIEKLDDSGRIFQISLFVTRMTEIYDSAPDDQIVRSLRASVGELLLWTKSKRSVAVVQHAFWSDIASALPNSRLVYDCMDHHEGFSNTGSSLIELEKQLFVHADLTVTTSDWLDQKVAETSDHHVVIRNGGEFAHFAYRPAKVYEDPEKRKILGYYGAIAEWFDIELVEEMARKFSDCCILLIGADTINARIRLGHYTNIKFVGEIPYAELPFYLYAFDVCLLPFKVVPLTLATNPVKAYEYLSAGKPIVAPELPEMSQFGDLVYMTVDHDAFLAAVDEVVSQREPQDLVERRIAFAKHETWIHRAATLIDKIENEIIDPKVSVVVVTYNNLALTQECLRSLDTQSDYENIEIIVVDNASRDGSPDFLNTWVAGAKNRKLILNADNRGFAAANNQGLKAGDGEFLVMLNNDTVVTRGWVRTLSNHLRRNSTIGIIGPVTGNIGNEAKVDVVYANTGEMPRAAAEYTNRHIGQIFELRTVAFFCVMLRKSVFEEIGPLDEAFGRGFFEDDDYCRRIEQAGLKIACADDVFVHHHLSASFNKLKQQDRQKLFDDNKKTYEAKWGEWVRHSYRSGPQKMISKEIIRNPRRPSLAGLCNVCGQKTRFEYDEKGLWRESLFCRNCRSSSRYRSITRGILKALQDTAGTSSKSLAKLPQGSLSSVRVYDTQPPFYYSDCAYPLPDLLKASGVSVELSQYKPELPAGSEIANGVTNQNLEHLTFSDESFDLVVTSDVMEHVRLDAVAHKEIFRVLKPGGFYVFTVPNEPTWSETQIRVKVTEPSDPSKDEHILEPEYHGDTNGTSSLGVLSYRTYGRDLLAYLNSIGFSVEYTRENIERHGIMNTELYYCKKVGPAT